MPRLTAKLCHGGDRHPREPIGWTAPLVRAAAAGLTALTSLAVLALALGYALSPDAGVAAAVVLVGFTGFALAAILRYVAGFLRHGPLTLRATRVPRS